jgi:hypothetical protein
MYFQAKENRPAELRTHASQAAQKRKRPALEAASEVQKQSASYFGAGVVLPLLFLPFLPPLWPFLPPLWFFFPLSVVVGEPVCVPPVLVCANDRLAPSRIANTNVATFFMSFSPLEDVSRVAQLDNSCGVLATKGFA